MNIDRFGQYFTKLQRYSSNNLQSGPLNLDKIQNDIKDLQIQIDQIIDNSNKIDLLSKLFLYESHKPNSYNTFAEIGAFPFIIGLCLKKPNSIQSFDSVEDYEKLCETVINYIDLFTFELIAKNQPNKNKEAELSYFTQIYNMLNKVNYGGYQFQFNEYANEVFANLSPYFEILAISPRSIIDISNKILENIDANHKKIIDKSNEAFKLEKEKYNKNKRTFLAQTRLTSQQAEKNLELYHNYVINSQFLYNISNSLCFKPEELYLKGTDKFNELNIYLEMISCKFGDQRSFQYPNDHNIIFEHPVINLLGGEYFCPKPDLLLNYHLILEEIVKNKLIKFHPNIFQKLQDNKKDYSENKPYTLLSGVFPKGSVYKNLYYNMAEKEKHSGELDNFVYYDNSFIFFESKSGILREKGLSGKLIKFRDDFNKIIKEGDTQIERAIEYIQSTPTPTFRKKDNSIVLKFQRKSNLNIIKIVLTFVPFRGLLINPNYSKSSDASSMKRCLIFSIFDLDIIIRFLKNPTLFMTYLEERIALSNKEDEYFYPGELPYLAHFMKFMNLDKFENLDIDRTSHDIFDNHFNNGKEPPQININEDIAKILKLLEESQLEGFIKTGSKLLSLDYLTKGKLTNKIREKMLKARKYKKSKWFSMKADNNEFGLTYLATFSEDIDLTEICEAAKYKYKKKAWYGIEHHITSNSIKKIIQVDDTSIPSEELKNKTIILDA